MADATRASIAPHCSSSLSRHGCGHLRASDRRTQPPARGCAAAYASLGAPSRRVNRPPACQSTRVGIHAARARTYAAASMMVIRSPDRRAAGHDGGIVSSPSGARRHEVHVAQLEFGGCSPEQASGTRAFRDLDPRESRRADASPPDRHRMPSRRPAFGELGSPRDARQSMFSHELSDLHSSAIMTLTRSQVDLEAGVIRLDSGDDQE